MKDVMKLIDQQCWLFVDLIRWEFVAKSMLGVVVELPGWVQQMMGRETLQMIYDKYYSHIKNYQREDGSAFMKKFYEPTMELTEDVSKSDKKYENFTPRKKWEIIGRD